MKNNKKELRVYVLDAADTRGISGYDIEDWSHWKEEKLPYEAEEFITNAEKEGRVYSLEGFMNAVNIEESISERDYVFITDKW